MLGRMGKLFNVKLLGPIGFFSGSCVSLVLITTVASGAMDRERSVSVSIQSYALAPLVLSNSDCSCTLPRRFLERFTAALEIYTPPLDLSPFKMILFWHPRMQTDPAHKWLRKQVTQATSRQRKNGQPVPPDVQVR
jgi:DNA-binding transcriptional LysR family regulator